MESSTFTQNKGAEGGSINVQSSQLYISYCSFDGEYALDDGGSIYVQNGYLGANFSNVENSWPNGIYVENSEVSLYQSYIGDNGLLISSYEGGGLVG